jgi:hypothetical protein
MSKIVAFLCVAAALAVCLWFAPWRTLMAQAQIVGPAVLTAGGLFTIAIAVLIRD